MSYTGFSVFNKQTKTPAGMYISAGGLNTKRCFTSLYANDVLFPASTCSLSSSLKRNAWLWNA